MSQGLAVEKVPLVASTRRIPDHAGGPAGQGDRAVTGVLKAPQHQQPDQISHVETVCGGIAAVVDAHRAVGEQTLELGSIGGVLDQATRL